MRQALRFERGASAALTALAALVVAALPVVPGHDVPQHLAYVRLLAAWQTDPSALPDVYAPPDASNVYATTYRALAALARWTSPDLALRLSLVAYVVLLALGVRALVRATWRARPGESAPPVTSLLGPVVAFHPVLCMGLLAYVLALPPLVGAVAVLVDFVERGRRRGLAIAGALAAATAALHAVAGAALVLFAVCLLAFRRDRRAALGLLACGGGLAVTARLLGSTAQVPSGLGAALAANVRGYGLVAGIVGTFRISFTHWAEKLNQVLASLLGPFPATGKALVAIVAAGVIVVTARARARARGGDDAAPAPVRGLRPACLAFATAAVLAPAALQVPDDLSLLDFRLITTATILGVACVPPGALALPAPRAALAASAAAVLALWARQLTGTAGEVMETVRLTARLDARDRLLALPMHDASAFLDPHNLVLHYAAVHHTARTGGVTSLFWARYSPRLPVGYAPGREPPRPADWAPWELTEAQLFAFTHVVVRWPDPGDDPRLRALAGRVEALRDQGTLVEVACEGAACLFEVAPPRVAR